MKHRRKNIVVRQSIAFTLLELLLSVSILTVVSSVLFSFFYSGKMVYKRLHEDYEKSSQIESIFQILRRDIEQITEWQNCRMILDAERLYFYTASEEGMGSICRIDYFIKPKYINNEKLTVIERCERKYPYKQDEADETLKTIRLPDNYKSVSFKVFAKRDNPDAEKKSLAEDKNNGKIPSRYYVEFPKWKINLFPLAVKMDIQNISGENFQTSVFLPLYRYEMQNSPVIKITDEHGNET